MIQTLSIALSAVWLLVGCSRTKPALVSQESSVLNPDHLPVYQGSVGTVEGRVWVRGPASPTVEPEGSFSKCPRAKNERANLFREGEAREDGSRALADALVGVIGYSGFVLPVSSDARTIVLDDCAASPRTVDVTFGQRIELTNRTEAVVAPTLEVVPSTAIMAAGRSTGPIRIYPQKPGHFAMRDALGSGFIAADVYVLLHPLHAVSDAAGRFRIERVPVGALKAFARLPAIRRETVVPVVVRAGEVTPVDLVIDYEGGQTHSGDRTALPSVH